LSQVWYMTGQPGGRVRIDRRSIIAPLDLQCAIRLPMVKLYST
jgi:hypothetical protein